MMIAAIIIYDYPVYMTFFVKHLKFLAFLGCTLLLGCMGSEGYSSSGGYGYPNATTSPGNNGNYQNSNGESDIQDTSPDAINDDGNQNDQVTTPSNPTGPGGDSSGGNDSSNDQNDDSGREDDNTDNTDENNNEEEESDAPPDDERSPVEVIITSDNAYGFGYGDAGGLANYFGGIENSSAGEIFNCGNGPETYTVPSADADAGDFLYVIGWSDDAVTQGTIAQFRRGNAEPITTGYGAWEVCATGYDFDIGQGGPDVGTINSEIYACNFGNGLSDGWVGADGDVGNRLAIGEDNRDGGDFREVCGLPTEAKWMWYDWGTANPFRSNGQDNGEFLIFRLPVEDIDVPEDEPQFN